MITTDYEITHKRATLKIEAMVSGMHLTFHNLSNNVWFWVILENNDNYLQFREQAHAMIQTRRSLGSHPVWRAVYRKATDSEGRQELAMYVVNSVRSDNLGGFTLKIMNEPENPLIEFEMTHAQFLNLLDESAKLLDIKSNHLKKK
jgi:hypothetical protein